MATLRPELTELPARIARLPIDERGYPVPFFVAWMNDKPEFRAMDPAKWVRCVQEKRCWVCGDYLGRFLCFVVGPMCGLSRTTSEPPSHAECAEWSAVNCPFLSRPHAHRREDELTRGMEANIAGMPIMRNPGVTLLWTTTAYRIFDAGGGKPLIEMGPPTRVAWVTEGRDATRAEVEASVNSGLPRLQEACDNEPTPMRQMDSRLELAKCHARLVRLYPSEEFEADHATTGRAT